MINVRIISSPVKYIIWNFGKYSSSELDKTWIYHCPKVTDKQWWRKETVVKVTVLKRMRRMDQWPKMNEGNDLSSVDLEFAVFEKLERVGSWWSAWNALSQSTLKSTSSKDLILIFIVNDYSCLWKKMLVGIL